MVVAAQEAHPILSESALHMLMCSAEDEAWVDVVKMANNNTSMGAAASAGAGASAPGHKRRIGLRTGCFVERKGVNIETVFGEKRLLVLVHCGGYRQKIDSRRIFFEGLRC